MADTSPGLYPPLVKLGRLRLAAAEARAAAVGMSQYEQDLGAHVAQARRRLTELREHSRTGDVQIRERIESRIRRTESIIAYGECALADARARHAALNARAHNAQAVAERLAEHLRAELAELELS